MSLYNRKLTGDDCSNVSEYSVHSTVLTRVRAFIFFPLQKVWKSNDVNTFKKKTTHYFYVKTLKFSSTYKKVKRRKPRKNTKII